MPMDERELDECLEMLHRAIRRVITAPQSILAQRRLGRAHHRALFTIRREPGIAVGDLAARTAITKQALHKTVRDLIRRGLVRSTVNPRNRRSRQLSLTRTGYGFEERLSGVQRGLFAAARRKVGPRKMRQWSEVARALAEA